MTSKTKNGFGFTIVELIIAMAIISIMIGFGAPALMDAYGNLKLRGQARDMYSAFQKARSEAIKQDSDVIIVFCETGDPLASDGVDNRYLIFIDNGTGNGGTDKGNGVWNDSDELLLDIKMPGDITIVSSSFTGAQSDTSFNSRGIPTKSGSIVMKNSVRWYKLSLSTAGNVNMQISQDGTWPP
ncbi:MAG: GspH/FimT family protein [Desulfobacula sp.]|nr:GspH/FimT family protein [Desulfobacula sp.]